MGIGESSKVRLTPRAISELRVQRGRFCRGRTDCNGDAAVPENFPEGAGDHNVVKSAGEALANEGAALAKSGKGVGGNEVVALEE
eukprot:11177782-Prorocentrum_lima.AAC.1